MGQWENKLQELLKLFEDNQKQHDEFDALWQKVINGAKAFITAHAKCNPLLAKGYSEMMDAQEEAGRAVAELSVERALTVQGG